MRASRVFDSQRTARYGKYNEDKLILGSTYEATKRQGLNKACPFCGVYNYIAFKPPVKDEDGNKVISRINWVECKNCHVAYSLE